MTTRPVDTSVSAATLPVGSCSRIASSTASEIWSATLSGWPSETDSDVKRKLLMYDPLERGRCPAVQLKSAILAGRDDFLSNPRSAGPCRAAPTWWTARRVSDGDGLRPGRGRGQ